MHRDQPSIFAKLIVLSAVVIGGSAARAQGVTGSALTGTVTDPAGVPVAGAAVQLRNPATGDLFDAVSDKDGKYFLDNIASGGPYSLTVQGGVYEPITRDGIRLALGQRLNADIQLRTMMGEQVEIITHLDSLDDHLRTGPATRVNQTSINKLPLQGRNFTDLVSTDPRATSSSIGGQNNRYNNIQIDGGANNDLFGLAASGTPGGQSNAKPLSIEAIKEFTIQAAPFDVRQGSFAGGLVNAITKSGTNDFHGSLFGYYQNKSLAGFRDDPTFLNYSTGQFGASVGGPIVKDKVHFFIATDLQQKTSAFGNQFQISGTDPAADTARAGFDNTTVQRFVDILTNKYHIANPGTGLGADLGNPDRNLFVKVSTSLIDNSHLELSYNLVSANADILTRLPTSTTSPGRLRDGYELSNAGYGQANTTNTGRVKLTTNWDGGRLSNEFLGGLSFVRDSRQVPSSTPLILVKAGKLGAADSWLAAGAERFSQSNILDQNIYQLQDNLTFAVKQHRISVGTSNEFFNFRNVFLQAATGVWAFNSLDDFEAGKASAFQRRFGVSDLQDPGTAKFNVSQLGLYVQDEWAPLERVTFTPGLRIDVPILSKAVTNPVLANNATFPLDTGKMPSGNLLWSPRLGFNWDVLGTTDTVLRGGAGVFTGRPPYVWLSNAYSVNGLSQVQLTCTGATIPTFTPDPNAQPSDCSGGTGKPAAPTDQGEIDYFDPKTRYPQNLKVAFGVDQRLPFGIVAAADFLYTRDINGWYVTDENLSPQANNGEGRAVYGSFAKSTPIAFSAAPIRIDTVNLDQAVKVENKNGGNVVSATLQVQKLFLQSYGISVAYTYSKSQDLMSLTSSQALSNFQFAPLDGTIANRNLRASAFDRPHKVTVTGTAALPYGFAIGASYVGVSGLPYTWTVNGDVNADGINGNDLAYVPKSPSEITLADPTTYAALDKFISSQDCLQAARGGFVQRGACRNPWQSFLDMRFSWTSPNLKGEQRIEVQWDIFNVMNLLNKNWGHLDQVASFENAPSAFLKATGYDPVANRPVYTFTAPTTITSTVYSPTQSRWRMQAGARYLF